MGFPMQSSYIEQIRLCVKKIVYGRGRLNEVEMERNVKFFYAWKGFGWKRLIS